MNELYDTGMKDAINFIENRTSMELVWLREKSS